jgi:beta-glucosidase
MKDSSDSLSALKIAYNYKTFQSKPTQAQKRAFPVNPKDAANRLPYQNPRLSLHERIADLLGRMTLEEKIAQLYCAGWIGKVSDILFDEAGKLSHAKLAPLAKDGLSQLGRPSQARPPRPAAELTNAIQKFLLEETRLGIPALFDEEGLHGLMGIGATSFPQAIALASSWDEDLVESVFSAVARETRARGSNYVYTPVLDLARDPRWGRVEETYGEDPYLVSRMGVAAIHGLQGRDGPRIDKQHVLATAKHYAVHGQPEGGQNAAPGNISERVIREQFLLPFQAAVMEAGVGAVMASYNEIDGLPSHINHWLLQDVLREEWGFQGFVTSDGMGVPQLVAVHHVAADAAQAARMAIQAGVDIEIPEGQCYPSLLEQARAGQVAVQTIDRAVGRILRAKFLLGLLDEAPFVDPDQAEQISNCPEHCQLALEAARKAIVLLKNQGDLLPLDATRIESIAVIGPNAADVHLGGYAMDPGRGVSVLEGVRQRAGSAIRVGYAEGCRITEGVQGWEAWHRDQVRLSDPADDDQRIAEAVALARASDAAVLVIGGNEATCREGWWSDHLGDRDSLELLGRQDELVRAVLATSTPTVVVLINGRPLAINFIAEHVAAILECWYLGQEGGTAVAEALFGDINPSGKLPISFPRNVGQLPVYYNHKPSAKRGYLFSTTEPLFPFGHGLSYTTFSYTNLRLDPPRIPPDGRTLVRVEVTNTGTRPGDEIVQLYIHDQISSLTRPLKELKGFKRIHLEPGQTRTVEFSLGYKELACLGLDMQPQVEPGLFDVMVGTSSVENLTVVLEVF